MHFSIEDEKAKGLMLKSFGYKSNEQEFLDINVDYQH